MGEYDESTDPVVTVASRHVEGEAHSYHYTNANKQPYIIEFKVNKLISESFIPDEDEPYGHHGGHGRIKRQGRGRRSTQTGKHIFMAQGRPKGGVSFGTTN